MQNENEFAVYNAVQCSDVNWPRSWAKWNSLTPEKVYQAAPFQAWDNAWRKRGVRVLAGEGARPAV